MDELVLLRDFRLTDAADVADARRDVERRLEGLTPARRRHRRALAIAFAVLAAVAVTGAAYGVARALLPGDPAPAEIKDVLVRFGRGAELIPIPSRPDDPRIADARVAAVIESRSGPAYLFSAPTAQGHCGYTWIEGGPGHQGRLLSSFCGPVDETFWAVTQRPVEGKPLLLFSGRAGDGVARIGLRVAGREFAVPLVNRWFFAELASRPDAVISYDAGGHVISEHELPPPPWERRDAIERARQRHPRQAGPAREVLALRTEDGERVSLFVAPATTGGSCTIVRSDERPPNRGCSFERPAADEIGVGAMQFGGAPGGVQLLIGPVGERVAALELRHQDGRVAALPLRDGWTLYEVPRRDYREGRRPVELVGRSSAGQVVARLRLPWG